MPDRPRTHKPGRAPPSEAQRRRALQIAALGTRQARGYTDRWLRYSRARLAREPWCVAHLALGLVVTASVTDHVTPHRGDSVLFWDEGNHQSLCKSCHDRKTAREDGGLGHRRTVKG